MIYRGSPDDLKIIIGERKEEITRLARIASEALSSIIAFCYDSDEMKRFDANQEDIELKRRISGKDYLYDLLHAYIESGHDRKSRMEEFAENYQMNYSEVKEVIDWLGLEI